MKKQRKQYAPEEKVAILRRHLLEKEPISKLCDEVGLQPTVFYRWQKEFFENGAAAPAHGLLPLAEGSSRTGRLPSNRKRGPTVEPSRNGLSIWRRRSRPRMRSWRSLWRSMWP